MKILLTAFEPFGDRSVNASAEVIKRLPITISDHEIVTAVLPVNHQTAPQKLEALLKDVKPDAVVCLGEAGGIDWIQLEFVAINWMDFRIPDNSGAAICDAMIYPEGKTAYFSSLPLRTFETLLKARHIPVKISMTAGTYLCNMIFYTLMEQVEQTQAAIPAGFIHLPAGVAGDGKETGECTLEICVEGVITVLNGLSTHR